MIRSMLLGAIVAAGLLVSGCAGGTSTVVSSHGSALDGGLEVSLDREHTSCEAPAGGGERSCSVEVDVVNTTTEPRDVAIESIEVTTVDGSSHTPTHASGPLSARLESDGGTTARFDLTLTSDAEPVTVTVQVWPTTITFAWPA